MRFKPLLMAALLAGAVHAKDDDVVVVDRIVAVVNNDVVLQSEMMTVIEPRLQQLPPGIDKVAWEKDAKRQVLDTLIAEKLLEADMRKLRIDVTPEEIQRALDGTMADNNLTPDQFRTALTQQGMTLEDFRDMMRKQLMKMKVLQLKVKARVNVSDDDVKSAAKGQDNLATMRLKARHVLVVVPGDGDGVAQRARIDAAVAKLAAGVSFDVVAKEFSDDAASRERGGVLGEFGRGEMVAEFEKAAYALTPGVVSPPVRTPFGWHLILVDERVKPTTTAGDADQLRQQLYDKEVERQFLLYIDELKAQAFIEKR
jgi:peptidyl-prolyl cis-trans isomerase SurA